MVTRASAPPREAKGVTVDVAGTGSRLSGASSGQLKGSRGLGSRAAVSAVACNRLGAAAYVVDVDVDVDVDGDVVVDVVVVGSDGYAPRVPSRCRVPY
jgi:hypothetical protein